MNNDKSIWNALGKESSVNKWALKKTTLGASVNVGAHDPSPGSADLKRSGWSFKP
jgi:hypothetical protein